MKTIDRIMQEQAENRSAGPESAVRPLIPCTTCEREIPRGALTCIYCGQPTPASRIRRTAKKRRNPARATLGTFIMLAGFASFFYSAQFPLNVAVGLTALVAGAAITHGWQCAQCGAKVDRETVECPRCSLPFARRR